MSPATVIRATALVLTMVTAGGLGREVSHAAAPPTEDADTRASANAAEWVQKIIADEQQFDRLRSLHLKLKGKWTRTPEAIAKSRVELRKQYPDLEDLEKRFSNLWPEMPEELELAFDEHRVRKFSHWHNDHVDLRIWDGQRALIHTRYFTHVQEYYAFDKRPERYVGENFFIDLSWLRQAPHSFWWFPQKWSDEQAANQFGRPQDYVFVRERDYRGRRCLELKRLAMPARRLYVGTDDRRLHGQIDLTLGGGEQAVLTAISKAAGRPFKDNEEFSAWARVLPPEKFAELFSRTLDESGVPGSEHYLDEYREIAPGLWFPVQQGYTLTDQVDGKQIVSTRRDLELVEARVNEPLSDDLFKLELRDGVQVNDWSHDPPLFYKQKADRTPEEWKEIVAKHERENEEWRQQEAAREALIGKPAPTLPQSKWLNGEPLDWDALRGKVVLLHFWAHWCGPCHSDLPVLAGLSKQAAHRNLVIIGVHNPGSELADIERDIAKNEIGYPVLIDVATPGEPETWGQLLSKLAANSIPHCVLIDPEGKIAAQGRLGKVLEKALNLLKAGDK